MSKTNPKTKFKDNTPHYLLFVVHGMGNQFEGLGKFHQNLNQLKCACKEVISEEFSTYINVEWIPIEWHSLLHQLESADERIRQVTLPTIPLFRNVSNDVLADVLYYFSSFHGQKIIDIVTNTMNEAYKSFINKYPKFKGKVGIFGHSLGGIISYDILANQNYDQSPSKTNSRPSHFGIQYPTLDFQPSALFAIGSPIAAVLIFRGQYLETYCIPKEIQFFNIFNLYDPLSYRMEPLLNKEYYHVSPVILSRPSMQSKAGFQMSYSYYRDQIVNYVSTTSILATQSLSNLPTISLPTLAIDLSQAKETLNKQFSTVFDSLYNVSSIFSYEDTQEQHSLKRKRDDQESVQEEKHEESRIRLIRQPISQRLRKHSPSPCRADSKSISNVDSLINVTGSSVTDVNSNTSIANTNTHQSKSTSKSIEEVNMERNRSSPIAFANAISEGLQGHMNTLMDKVITPVIKKIKGSSSEQSSSSTTRKTTTTTNKSPNESPKQENKKNIPVMDLKPRLDYCVQESVLENSVHQYLTGLKSHFSYWWNKDVHYFILQKLMESSCLPE